MVVKRIKKGLQTSKYIIYRETLIDYKEFVWSFIGAIVGIGIIAFIQSKQFADIENVFLIGSFGASSVLIYGAVESPLAQPRNLLGGHFISALIGVTVYKVFPETIWITAPLAVGTSIVFMQLTKTLHPPGGATALIAIMGSERIKELGYYYVLSPVLSGAFILLAVALIFNNITTHRKYPTSKRVLKLLRMMKLKQ